MLTTNTLGHCIYNIFIITNYTFIQHFVLIYDLFYIKNIRIFQKVSGINSS